MMKLIPLLMLLLLPACDRANSKIPAGRASVETEKRSDGLVYGKNSATPFSGEVIVFTHGTNRQSVETFLEGKPHGLWKRYWSNGTLKREQQWVHGSQTHQRQWYEDGALKEDLRMKDGLGNGLIRLWWPDGRLRRTAFVGDDLRPHGHALEYAPDGTVIVDAIFDHGTYISGLLKEDALASQTHDKAD